MMEQKERKMILQVENLERSYAAISQEGKKIEYPAVRGITFDVYEGEFIAIMGRSGCGKTTLLKTIGMVDKPTFFIRGRKQQEYSEIVLPGSEEKKLRLFSRISI